MRKHRKQGHRAEGQRAKPADRQAGIARPALAGRLGHHRVGGPAERELAGGIEQNRRGKHHHHQREGKRIPADVFNSMKNLDGGHAREIEHQRHAEFGEGPDENNRPAGKNSRHDERERDFAKLPEARASEVFGSLLHRGVHIRQRGEDIQVDDRIEIQRDERHHTPNPPLAQPIDRRLGIQHSQVHQKGIQCALLPEDLLHPDRSHKWRHDHRNQDQSAQNRLAGKNKAVAHPSERHRDQAGKHGAEDPDSERIPQSLEIKWIPENLGDVIEREPPIGSHKGSPHGLRDRPQKKQGEKNSGQSEDDFGKLVGHYFPSLASRAASLYWARNLSESSFASRTSSMRFFESNAFFKVVRAVS